MLVVRSFQELDAAGERVRGKIVLFNVPFTNYGETVQYRGSGPSRAGALGAVAALVRAVGPPGLRTPSHRRAPLRRRAAADPGRRDHRGRRRTAAAHAGSRQPARVRLKMEAQVPARCRFGQRRRRNPRPRAAGRSRGDRRPLRLVGRRHRLDRRRRRVRRHVGSAAADEEAEPAAAPDRAGRAVDQRGERHAAADRPTSIAIAISWPTTC